MEQYLGGVSSATSLTSLSPPPVWSVRETKDPAPRNTRYYSLPCEGSVAQLPRTPCLRACELRRILLPRTPVNKGIKKKGRGVQAPALNLCYSRASSGQVGACPTQDRCPRLRSWWGSLCAPPHCPRGAPETRPRCPPCH